MRNDGAADPGSTDNGVTRRVRDANNGGALPGLADNGMTRRVRDDSLVDNCN